MSYQLVKIVSTAPVLNVSLSHYHAHSMIVRLLQHLAQALSLLKTFLPEISVVASALLVVALLLFYRCPLKGFCQPSSANACTKAEQVA